MGAAMAKAARADPGLALSGADALRSMLWLLHACVCVRHRTDKAGQHK